MKSGIGRMSLIISLAAATASGAVGNPGFETGDFSEWLTFGQGWRTAAGDDAFSGAFGAVNDVNTNDVDNFRGVFQNIPVTAGVSYNAGVYIRAVNVESSESWFELQWLDSDGGIVEQLQTAHVTADQPFTLMALSEVIAPIGAVTASVRGIVFMPSAPAGDTDFQIFDEFFLDALFQVDLQIELTAPDNVEVSWSTNVSGYQLESSSDLVDANWSPVLHEVNMIADRMVVTNATLDGMNFRLRKP